MRNKDYTLRRCSWLWALLVLVPIGGSAQTDTDYEMVMQLTGGSEVTFPIKDGYPQVTSFPTLTQSGEQYLAVRVIYGENKFYELRSDQVSNLTSRPVQALSDLEPISEDWEVDFTNKFKAHENLYNRVIDNVYLSMDSRDNSGYDEAKKGLVFRTSPEWLIGDIVKYPFGDYRVGLEYPGLIIKVGKGKGTITVDAQTSGDYELKIVNGSDPWTAPKNYMLEQRGQVSLNYRVTKPTYYYIYAYSSYSWKTVYAPFNYVVIHGVKVDITTLGVDNVDAQADTYGVYTTDGCLVGTSEASLSTLPKGIYVIKENNRQTYKYISR